MYRVVLLPTRVVRKVWRRLSSRVGFRWRAAGLALDGVAFGRAPIVEPGVSIRMEGGEVVLGDGVWLGQGVFVQVWPGGRLVIGDDVYVGRHTILLVHSSLTIGHHTMISPYCHITDVNHGMESGRPMRGQPLVAEPVAIEDDVWVGAGCSVLPGVTLGAGCVVGARGCDEVTAALHGLRGCPLPPKAATFR